ncbi:MAG: hypothetical protein Q8J76_04465, partial [Desulfobulbaceae bacterium]|nr:hypothetical protein [Desulfobulbaceae bacterium]
MRTFAPKTKAAQMSTFVKFPVSCRGNLRRSRVVNSSLPRPSAVGRRPDDNARERKRDSTMKHDAYWMSDQFSGALNYMPAPMTRSDGDMRGEGEGYELDQRVGETAPPDHRMICRASATGVSLGASGAINDGTLYGLRTPIIVRGTELGDVLDSELVGASIDHTGSMTSRPSARSNNSGFMAADNIPDDRHTSGISDHLSYFDNHGGDGSYSRLQMDLYKIPSCNITTPWPISNSGYRIKREVKA